MSTTRRTFLRHVAVAPTAAAASIAGQPAWAALQSNNLDAPAPAHPDLVALSSLLRDATGERKAALDTMEWLVAEWRHRWPLAPDGITLPGGGGSGSDNEVDLGGRPVVRPGEARGRRLRNVETLATLAENMAASVDRTRNEKERARRQAAADRYSRDLRDGVEYYREIERIKEASGVRGIDARVKAADREITRLCKEIMAFPVQSLACLAIKAEAVETWIEANSYDLGEYNDIFGWPVFFARDILTIANGGAA
ncbi:secreted protein [Pseudaminobacter salicylatoxidans]|uniref:Secreted protein n=1 Tax=Pseudaminobacter salicylatoxidans TaxID=93369 RepID=A0A316BLH3_PSESE|nr:twin-arginine translocation signal domain-containing protein [Pseudaminobacter salicylatoxidans]PWJ73852.1 secreted protein [Pseudaminobacter salicylatoxidans]